jgi:hypothetical protein
MGKKSRSGSGMNILDPLALIVLLDTIFPFQCCGSGSGIWYFFYPPEFGSRIPNQDFAGKTLDFLSIGFILFPYLFKNKFCEIYGNQKTVRQLIFSLPPGPPHTRSPPEHNLFFLCCRSGSRIRYFLTSESEIRNG